MQFNWGVLCLSVRDKPGGSYDLLGVGNTLHAADYPATFSRTLAVCLEGDNSARGIRLSVTARLSGEAGTMDDEWELHFIMTRDPQVMAPTAVGTFVFDELAIPTPGYYRFEILDEDRGLIGIVPFLAVRD